MSPKYSFVLPAYKATFLRESIDSILNQTYKDFELIIVNDASPEDLNSIVNSYHDERIRYYVNEKNIGGTDLVAQWNYCISHAIGKYLILASDDDVYHPEYLEKMDVLVCKYPEINVFRPRIQVIDSFGTIESQMQGLREKVNQIEYIYNWMRGCVGSGIGYFIFLKEALMQYGGFFSLPLAWGSDDVTVIELAKPGIVFSSSILFSFRNSGLNISSKIHNASTLRMKLQAYKIFEEWFLKLVYRLGEDFNDSDEYYCYIRNNKNKIVREGVVYLLRSSFPSAIFFNLKYFFQLKCVSFVWGMFWISKVSIERLIRFVKKQEL